MMLTEEYHKLVGTFKQYGSEPLYNSASCMSTLTTQALKHSRLHGLDYLRGIAALGIMVYHYSSWTIGERPASSVLGRIGIYGVAIFYILSGQALSFNYNNQLNPTISSLKNFYKKRAYRIFPLFWAVTIASVILSKQKPALQTYF
jgi:peptidoglycan/LPS O-acetylase OafA/YrhL